MNVEKNSHQVINILNKTLEKYNNPLCEEPVYFHLGEMLDVANGLREKMEKLLELCESPTPDWERIGKTLVDLEIEIYSHGFYHAKRLRGPLKKMIEKIYGDLDDDED